MNPDPYLMSIYAAGRESALRDMAAKRARSRASQPRRKDNRKIGKKR